MKPDAPNPSSAAGPSKVWNILLWVVQIILALLFLYSAYLKLGLSIAEFARQGPAPWAPTVPAAFVRFIGIAELAGALGVVLPAATRIKPILTPLAAVGLFTILVLAVAFHLSRGESYAIGIPAALTVLPAFVAWGRFRKAPIPPRP